jgi:hypothetical protein
MVSLASLLGGAEGHIHPNERELDNVNGQPTGTTLGLTISSSFATMRLRMSGANTLSAQRQWTGRASRSEFLSSAG